MLCIKISHNFFIHCSLLLILNASKYSNHMKHISTLILSILILFSCNNKEKVLENEPSQLTSTYYFIRHAEKDRSDTSNVNPHLLEVGKQRAEHWNDIFKNINFDAVYSTDYNRTRETALPTARKNNLELTIYNPGTINIPEFLKETKGKTVLIVGHSNTTPNFVNTILGIDKYREINDSNNANLFVVTVSENQISDFLLYIN